MLFLILIYQYEMSQLRVKIIDVFRYSNKKIMCNRMLSSYYYKNYVIIYNKNSDVRIM